MLDVNNSVIVGFLDSFIIDRYAIICTLTVLVYEYVLTFNEEVHYIWKRRWSFGKVMFLFNRYWSLFNLIVGTIMVMSDEIVFNMTMTDSTYVHCGNKWFSQRRIDAIPSCRVVRWSVEIAMSLWIVGVQVVLQARIYAVYSRSKRVLLVLLSLFILEIIAEGAFFLLSTHGPLISNTPDAPTIIKGDVGHHGLSSCSRNGAVQNNSFLVWIPAIVFESLLLLIMFAKAWTIYREDSRSPLVILLLRDSFLYFFTVFAIMLINCILSAIEVREHHGTIPPAMAIAALPSCVGCRLLINMNEQYLAKKNTEPPTVESVPKFRARSIDMPMFSTVMGSV